MCLVSHMARVGKKRLQNVQLRCFYKLFQGLKAKPLSVVFFVLFFFSPKLFLSSLCGASQCYISSNCNTVEAGDTVLCETLSTSNCNAIKCHFLRNHYFSEVNVLLPELMNFIKIKK